MFSKELIPYFEELLYEKILSVKPLSGGDINEVYLLTTKKDEVVIKINDASIFPGMFQAEAKGLETLKKSNTFTIPEVLHIDEIDGTSFLMMQYIDSNRKVDDFWEIFGKQLAELHQQSEVYFGFENDNYIGSLPQFNDRCVSASEFYILQRLEPQFKLAINKGFSFSNLDRFYRTIENKIPQEPSSLIHGDLWSGNFMIDHRGLPCLIDPAVSYAPREMDIAMMYLFGGFDTTLFDIYNEAFPLSHNWKERLTLWQLYYLLVHLNLFGRSYYDRVRSIVNQYS
ncbi:fructosamine kinase family protein [Aquimarina sp. 2201CG5-10]|uniref:fructosamine kinase family protein n=1 Tax=Aquimarina callyspongiae TaxID=3098150 RepID=UPI002AB4A833|nr:fructosamine kinase family protein [Aquimarina sp. 2201CG5-10]MDY8136572.1 fructosamine kinase family protein [Aquimarina sp. 2201CG5-10]